MINAERIAAEFERLAAIASPSFREGNICRYLVERLERLGGTVHVDAAGEAIGAESGNLIAHFPARGREAEPLLLAVHMDTVGTADKVEPVLRDGVFTSAGETVLGADDKAGIAEVIEAIEVLQERKIPHGPLEVVVTVCEEVGLLGAKHLDVSLLRSSYGLALDTAGVDLAIHRAPCANKLRFEVTGREAHAGIAPEKGLSAIQVAARAIGRMRLGRIDAETTANIGIIEGGEAINIVPKKVLVEGEVRSHDAGRLKQQTEEMVALFRQAAEEACLTIDGEQVRAEVRSEVLTDYPLMHVPRDARILQLLEQASAALDRPLEVRSAGGGSDANVFNRHGIEMVILGTGMTDVHSVKESVKVADMVRVAELLVETIRRA